MKKFLLATGLFLSFGLMASAQQKNTQSTTTPETVLPVPVTKQQSNKQKLVSQNITTQNKVANKNEILKSREKSAAARTRNYKRTKITAKTTGN